jgi:lysophospholipid acyltransferase (LPLAT)-like uncharacterized protein
MDWKMRIQAFLASVLIRLLGNTWRIEFNESELEPVRSKHPAVIYALWHGRILPLSFTHRNRSAHVLASEHRDGELMGQTIRFLGFGHVRGSSTRRGTRAILELAEKIREGYDVALTVDGPKGPLFTVKAGAIEIAKLTGAPIVPITAGSARHWTLSSWDKFQVPRPFTRVRVRQGEPVFVNVDAGADEIEAGRRLLEGRLRDITRENDERLSGEKNG